MPFGSDCIFVKRIEIDNGGVMKFITWKELISSIAEFNQKIGKILKVSLNGSLKRG